MLLVEVLGFMICNLQFVSYFPPGLIGRLEAWSIDPTLGESTKGATGKKSFVFFFEEVVQLELHRLGVCSCICVSIVMVIVT